MRKIILLSVLIFSQLAYSASNKFKVSGSVYDDYNFGGNSREFDSSKGMKGLKKIKVELSEIGGSGSVQSKKTNANGYFKFNNIRPGTYTLTIKNTSPDHNDLDGELYSARGNCEPCLPVQVYPEITTGFSRQIVVSNSNIYNANIGINYSTVLNNNDRGVGSLRQFLINSRYLDGNSSKIEKEDLKQVDLPSDYDNAIFTLGSDKTIVLQSPLEMLYTEETSIDARDINLTLKNHRVAQNTDYGLKIHFSEENFIQGLIFDGFDDSVYINDSSEISLDWNTFKNTRDSGITIWGDSDENLITNNIFENNVNAEDVDYQAAALFMNNSNDNRITNNTFINAGDDHRSDGGYTFHVSAIRVYYGNGNLISENSFKGTRGISIDLRGVEHLGYINPNDGRYNNAASTSNQGIDFPVIQTGSITSNGELNVTGYIGLTPSSPVFGGSSVEIYLAEGSPTNHTLNGTDFIGRCIADSNATFDCTLPIPNGLNVATGSIITGITIARRNDDDDDDDDDHDHDEGGNTSEMGSIAIVTGSEDLSLDIYSLKSTPLTCEKSVFNIDIIDSYNNNDLTNYTGDVNVSLTKVSGIGDLSQLCWLSDNPAGVGKVSCDQGLVMSFDDETSRTLYLESYHQDMEVTAYAEMVDDTTKNDTSGIVKFGSEGFTLDLVSSDSQGFKAGVGSQLTLTRIETLSNGSPVCAINEHYNGNKNVGFKLHYLSSVLNRVNASITSSRGTTAVTESGYNDAKIMFYNGIATADFYYDEAGKISLDAYYQPPGNNPNDSMWKQSKAITVTPYQLRIEEISSGTGSDKKLNQSGNSLNGKGFVAAEVPFDFLLKAYSARNDLVTQNFNTADGDMLVGVAVLSPASKTGELAQLRLPTGVPVVFSDGIADLDGFKYGEVGSFYSNFMVTDYLDLTKIGHLSVNSPEVGRFFPARFELTSQSVTTDFTAASGYWTYLGKPDIDLTYQLEALGADGRRLTYYEPSGYAVDTIGLNLEDRTAGSPVSSLYHRLVMPESITTGGTFKAVWSGGVQTINATGLNALSVVREATGVDGPYESSVLFLSRASALDAVQFRVSGVFSDTADIGGDFALRYGRLNVKDTFGPTNTDLPMDMQIEYWDGDSFEVNTWDDADTYLDKEMSHSSDTPNDLNVGFVFDKSAAISKGVYALKVSGDKDGSTLVSSDLANFPWLQYCWSNATCTANNYQNNPLAQAIFGTQRPSDRVIYWQEMFY